MCDDDMILAYVKASAALLDLSLDDAWAQRVTVHLSRTAGMAKLLENVPLGVESEPAEVYRPAPFPPLLPDPLTA
jgi:Protein of unknown function (DUF4089)